MSATLFSNTKGVDCFELKALEDNKINVIQKLKFLFGSVENISPFSPMPSKGFFLMVVKSQDYVVKG